MIFYFLCIHVVLFLDNVVSLQVAKVQVQVHVADVGSEPILTCRGIGTRRLRVEC